MYDVANLVTHAASSVLISTSDGTDQGTALVGGFRNMEGKTVKLCDKQLGA